MPEATIEPSNRQLLAVAVLFGLLSVDLAPVRFGETAAARWIVLGSLALAGIVALRGLQFRGAAERLLIAAFGWVLLMAPLGPTPLRSTVVAAALLGTVAIGVWIGRHFPWRYVEAAAIGSLTAILSIAVLLGDTNSPDGRWLGLSEEANALGELAALAVVLSIGGLIRRSLPAAPVVVLGGVVLFQTAAAIPALAAAIGIAFTVRPMASRLLLSLPRKFAVAGGAVSAAGLALAVTVAFDALATERDSVATLNNRTGIWSFLFDRIRERPFTGYGPWASGDLLTDAPFDARVSWGPTHGHNTFIELATMGGLPAAGLFLAAMAVIGWALVRSGHRAGAVAITLLAMSMTEHLVATPSLGLVLIGAILGASEAAVEAPRSDRALPVVSGGVSSRAGHDAVRSRRNSMRE